MQPGPRAASQVPGLLPALPLLPARGGPHRHSAQEDRAGCLPVHCHTPQAYRLPGG